jgi:VWFA-related protein
VKRVCRLLGITLALTAAVAVAPGAQPRGEGDALSVDLVEIDVVVVDKKGQPVRGLTQKDFSIKEDGKTVALTTFREISSLAGEESGPRSIVIALDDVVAPPVATQAMQIISRGVLRFADERDELAVVRLMREADEPYGDRRLAEERIARFTASSSPFLGYVTQREALNRIASLARELANHEQDRKVLLCIGSPVVCNVDEPSRSSPFNTWDAWVEAMTATARANVAVYAIVPGRAVFRRNGLVEHTGGELFPATYDVAPAVERILRDASNYYMLGYWPAGKDKDVRSLAVKVDRRGVEVRARKRRGR